MKDYIPAEDTNRKHYINKNVYEASKERIKDAILQSDSQAVLWSGGKDSTVVLKLVEEVYKEMGINQKVNAIFIDEEVISQHIIDYVQQIKDTDKYNIYWFNIPITCDRYNNGKTIEYIQNDRHRKKHVRTPPSDAITLADFNIPEDTILNRYQLADLQASLFKGKVCLFKGIRTDESLFRLTQVIRRVGSGHIGGHTKKHFECVPIYDWKARDVFLYFYKNNIQYNPFYNHLMWSNTELRVSTPLHPYTKVYNKLRSIEPEFYESITDVFPDMSHADRYKSKNIKTNNDFEKYPHTITGLMQYVDHCYKDKKENLKVKKQLLTAYKKREELKKKKYSNKCGGYPLYYLFRLVQKGALMRNVVPLATIPKKMYIFEGLTEKDYLEDKKNRGKYNEATNI